MQLRGKNGYNIPYSKSIPEGAETITIAMHGFCGDKESSCIGELEKKALGLNIGLIKFDWVGHGESEATGDQLTVDNCIADIDSIVEYIKKLYPKAKLVAFSTSFGGYLTLLYIHDHRETFDQVILRSPAINMYKVLVSNILDKDKLFRMEEAGSVEYGFERKLKITKAFLTSIKNNDIGKLYDNVDLPRVSIIHGTEDDLVPFTDSELFAQKHACRLYPVICADHRYKKDGEIEKVVNIALEIIESK